jgi:hypothetical protein
MSAEEIEYSLSSSVFWLPFFGQTFFTQNAYIQDMLKE